TRGDTGPTMAWRVDVRLPKGPDPRPGGGRGRAPERQAGNARRRPRAALRTARGDRAGDARLPRRNHPTIVIDVPTGEGSARDPVRAIPSQSDAAVQRHF